MKLNIRGDVVFEYRTPPPKIRKAVRRDVKRLKRVHAVTMGLLVACYIAAAVIAVTLIGKDNALESSLPLGILLVSFVPFLAAKMIVKQRLLSTTNIQQRVVDGLFSDFYVTEYDYSLQLVMSNLHVLQYEEDELVEFFKRMNRTDYDHEISTYSRFDSPVSLRIVRDTKLHVIGLARVVFGEGPLIEERIAEVETEVQHHLDEGIRTQHEANITAFAELTHQSQ